jgi:hypothetical protein
MTIWLTVEKLSHDARASVYNAHIIHKISHFRTPKLMSATFSAVCTFNLSVFPFTSLFRFLFLLFYFRTFYLSLSPSFERVPAAVGLIMWCARGRRQVRTPHAVSHILKVSTGFLVSHHIWLKQTITYIKESFYPFIWACSLITLSVANVTQHRLKAHGRWADGYGAMVNWYWQREAQSTFTLSTTDPTQRGSGSNPGPSVLPLTAWPLSISPSAITPSFPSVLTNACSLYSVVKQRKSLSQITQQSDFVLEYEIPWASRPVFLLLSLATLERAVWGLSNAPRS